LNGDLFATAARAVNPLALAVKKARSFSALLPERNAGFFEGLFSPDLSVISCSKCAEYGPVFVRVHGTEVQFGAFRSSIRRFLY
jgi:hypothetical protein